MFSNQTRKEELMKVEGGLHLAAASKPSSSDTVKSTKHTTDGCPISSQPHFGGFAMCNYNSTNGFRYNNFPNNNYNKYKKYDDRFNSFKTWLKSHPIKASNLARAGFVHTGQGDRVFCPCQLFLVEWETYDVPMNEHYRHSSKCEYMTMIFSQKD